MTRRDPQNDPRAFLGAELTRARVTAGFSSQEALAAELGYDRSVVGKAESGERVPSADVLAAWCEACKIDADLFARLATLAASAEGSPVPRWFEDWLIAEDEAQVLRYWAPIIVPALFHTEAYARELLLAAQSDTSDEAINALIAAKVARRAVLERGEPPDVTALIDECALHRLIGTPTIMAEQLTFIAEMAVRPNISVQVVPASNGANAGLGGPLNLASGEDMPAVAHMDGVPEGQTIERRSVVHKAEVAFDRIRGDALPRGASREIIAKAAEEWKQRA
jgi:transcriptional regulator with XRE-family HTH domain